MSIFITSDLHFGHRNILQYNRATRPYNTVEEMDEALIENWNRVIRPNDTVYNLGDLSFHRVFENTLNILARLNGRHILILGNHDQIISRRGTPQWSAAHNFLAEIVDYKEIRYRKRKIVMSHYSMRVWNCMHHGAIMLYGHSHGSLPGVGRSMDVGIDSSDMPSNQTPFLLDDVIEFLEKREIVCFDHHVSQA